MSGPFGASQFMYARDSGFYGFEISNSLRFDNASNQNLVFTPSSAGNLRAWTLSMWVKRSNISDQDHNIFSANAEDNFRFMADDTFNGSMYSAARSAEYANFDTSSVYRDGSAWYNIVYSWDSNNGTAANRLRVFVNGVNQTGLSGDNSYPSQNTDSSTNLAISHAIGKQANSTARNFDGYIAEVNFIDGTTHDASSFGEYKNDIWIPKNTSGLTFGTNGYRLQFKQTGTGQNASGVGADTSGNNNHFASSNITASDVVTDSPTNNFCLPNSAHKTDNIVFSEGNTKAVFSTFSQSPNGTIGASSGKWYYEVKMAGTHARMGFCESHCPQGDADTSTTFPLYAVYSNGSNGLTVFNSVTAKSSTANTGYTSFSGGDTLGLALDIDNGKFYAHLNGTYYNSGDPANGTGALVTGITAQRGGIFIPYLNCGTDSSRTFEFNFGAPSHAISSGNADENGYGNFEYAVPSGFLSLCTANLPAPVATIDPAQGGSPQDYFNTLLRNGTGSGGSVTGVGFQPDWYWEKKRNASSNHYMVDSVRGVTKSIFPNLTNAEGTDTNAIQSFDTDGFTWGSADRAADENLVVWLWKAGTAFSNDASATSVGSIDSSGSVNTDVGFSIIKWTAVGSSATQTIAHGLGAVPKMIIMKNRERAVDWAVYHEGLGNTHGMSLNTTAASSDDSGWWNDTTPTSTVFTTGNGNGFRTGGVAEDYIAYCFAEVDNYSKFGLYTGNGNADGPMVHTNFRPAFLIYVKTAGENWHMKDNKTAPVNVMTQVIDPNRNGAEVADANTNVDFLSNGFKLRSSHATQNGDGSTYIYMAFAEQPFKYSNAR